MLIEYAIHLLPVFPESTVMNVIVPSLYPGFLHQGRVQPVILNSHEIYWALYFDDGTIVEYACNCFIGK